MANTAPIRSGNQSTSANSATANSTAARTDGPNQTHACSGPKLKAALMGVAGVAEVAIDHEEKVVTAFPAQGQSIFGPISRLIQDRKLPVSEVMLERGRLDEVFRTITQTGVRS